MFFPKKERNYIKVFFLHQALRPKEPQHRAEKTEKKQPIVHTKAQHEQNKGINTTQKTHLKVPFLHKASRPESAEPSQNWKTRKEHA